ncbi:MAG: polymerase, sigma-24 subunit, subfamily [Verrucomicrobiales bacterium]|nr:polymerase, sigma-24 subunit, subfamily [Verrucomicrobiales bacterium]
MLAERYSGMVFGTALRRLGDAALAQEAAADVFALLARKAPSLTEPGCLAAWLQRSSVLVSANTARREQRRLHAMKSYAASLSSAPPAHDPAWLEALPHLDEGLAMLPERDRRILMARFFNQHSYGQIAQEQGGSEEGVRKAGQRALEKLAALLRRRGAGVSAALVAAALTDHLQAAAPAGVSGKLAAAASAPSISVLTHLNRTFALMIHGKSIVSPTLLILLCVLAGGGSYVAARQLARSASGSTGWPVKDSAAMKPAVFEKPVPQPRTVAAVMREVVDLLRGGSKDARRQDRALLLLAALSSGEMAEAAVAAEAWKKDAAVVGLLARTVAEASAEHDPAAALAWVETFPGPMRSPGDRGAGNIVQRWLETDGPAAWSWWLRRCQTGAPTAEWTKFVGAGLGEWVRQDVIGALTAAGEATTGAEEILKQMTKRFSQMNVKAESPAVDTIMQWKNPSLRATLARCLANSWDPVAPADGAMPDDLRSRLFPLLNRLCADDPGGMEAAVAPLIRQWSRQSPQEAVEWVVEQSAATPANTLNLLQPALRQWSERSAGEAWHWLDNTAAQSPEQAQRLYASVLEDTNVGRNGTLSMELKVPPAWAEQIAQAPEESQERFLLYWAQRRLSSLEAWRAEVSPADTSTAAALARRAMVIAEQLTARVQ